MDKNEQPISTVQIAGSTKLGMIICAAGIVFSGLIGWIYDYVQSVG